MTDDLTVLVIGASGSVGRLVVDELIRRGDSVRVLVRERSQGGFPRGVDVRVGNIADPHDYDGVLDDIDAVVFTQGSYGTSEEIKAIDYGAVRNVLGTPHGALRIVLMSTIGVTVPTISYNETSRVCDWKRRSERLVRASGLRYTIIRPSWFDANDDDAHAVVFLQGDQRTTGTTADGGVARQQIAEVLVAALHSESATFKTLELASEQGAAVADLNALFAALDADEPGAVNAVHDRDTQPLADEPAEVLAELDEIRNDRS